MSHDKGRITTVDRLEPSMEENVHFGMIFLEDNDERQSSYLGYAVHVDLTTPRSRQAVTIASSYNGIAYDADVTQQGAFLMSHH